MQTTLDYYQQHAERFAATTLHMNMSRLHDRFLAGIPPRGYILDAGCGAGRDSLAFIERGYRVHAIDASPAMARIATETIGQQVEVQHIETLTANDLYDGVWACASLLHLPEAELSEALQRLWCSLRPGGLLYASFKHGTGQRSEGGRHFTDATEARLRTWTAGLRGLHEMECWLTEEQRPDQPPYWLNALLRRAPCL